MAVPLAKPILEVVKQALVAWERFLATRQEAYNRKMDQNLRRSINEAEGAFRRLLELGIEVDDYRFRRAQKLFYEYKGRV